MEKLSRKRPKPSWALVIDAMVASGGNIEKAAEMLLMNPPTVRGTLLRIENWYNIHDRGYYAFRKLQRLVHKDLGI